jgi:type VI secretion system secreted protein VgrG
VGIWYRFTSDERLRIDVVEFCDDQRHYQFDVELPYHPQSGLSSSDQDSVWNLQSSHQVVEQQVHFPRLPPPRRPRAPERRHRPEPRRQNHLRRGLPLRRTLQSPRRSGMDQDEDLLSESGYFYARLRHERYLNDQTQLSGVSSSATLAPGQVLKVSGGAPQAFTPGAVITGLTTKAARDQQL